MPAKADQRKAAWGHDREMLLIKLWEADELSASQIAQQLGVTKNAVIGKARRLRCKLRRPNGWGGWPASKAGAA